MDRRGWARFTSAPELGLSQYYSEEATNEIAGREPKMCRASSDWAAPLSLRPKSYLKMPREYVEKEKAVGRLQRENFARAVKAGVKIAFGTDTGVSEHGENAQDAGKSIQVDFSLIGTA